MGNSKPGEMQAFTQQMLIVQGPVLAALWAMQTHQELPHPGQHSTKGQPPPPRGRMTQGSTLDLSEPSRCFPGKMRVITAATFCFVEKTEQRPHKGLRPWATESTEKGLAITISV